MKQSSSPFPQILWDDRKMNAKNDADILFVEDSSYDAELTIRALTRRHLANKLVHLKDGAEALDYIFGTGAYADRDTSNHPKVVLLAVC